MKVKINRTHISLFVSDPDASADWYEDVLSMEKNARNGDEWVMMSFGDKHHDIALIRAPEGSAKGVIGLQHYGLEIDGDLTTLRRLYGMLLTKNVPIVKTTDHEVGIGLYFEDPDGNRLEFFLETEHDDELGKQRFRATDAPSRPLVLEPIFD
ncbi:glyoxalase [Marinomonas sp. CT5]|uniref:VOC family protein n=1 Tax=Marinomonas sp. CT5 TaxID=2066133 RepID=UPI00185BB10A|nr:VOC family protein [Marinomonas sp. CT5]NVK71909.1 VOC family protein [Oceanospirillaceae bacterium]QUX94251.1 glyoxalase [Marinomonas sp. CT5]